MKTGEKWQKSNNRDILWKARTVYASFILPDRVTILEYNDTHVIFQDALGVFGIGKKALPKDEFLKNYERVYDEYQSDVEKFK